MEYETGLSPLSISICSFTHSITIREECKQVMIIFFGPRHEYPEIFLMLIEKEVLNLENQ